MYCLSLYIILSLKLAEQDDNDSCGQDVVLDFVWSCVLHAFLAIRDTETHVPHDWIESWIIEWLVVHEHVSPNPIWGVLYLEKREGAVRYNIYKQKTLAYNIQ